MTKCELCGEPMPAGEEMLKYHGYSGDCPKPPMPRDDCGVTGRPGPLPETGWDEVPADALRRALTAAQPAQATPESSRGMIGMGAHALANELAQAVAQDDADPDGHDMSAGLFGPNVSAWLRKISADYLPQHATPEPVGDVRCEGCGYMTHHREHMGCVRAAKQHTRPAPGVPEGLPAVLTDWGFDVHDDEEGRTWLTIRNPDDDVARMSVPTVWPLNGNQTIGAVVLHQFSAALTSALAAAQAKGQ